MYINVIFGESSEFAAEAAALVALAAVAAH